MNNFNTNTLVGRVQINDSVDIPGTPTPALQNSIFVYGNRRPLAQGETSLPVPVPLAGSPSYDYYQTYKLEDNLTTDPNGILAWFKACGYEINYGYSNTITLNNIIAFSPDPVGTNNKVTIYFSGQYYNLAFLANSYVTGTFKIASPSITGDIVSIDVGIYLVNNVVADTKIVLHATSFTGLATGLNVTLDFVKQMSIPDLNKTEPFIMNLWQGAQAMQAMNQINPNATVGAPAVYFAILPDSASTNYFAPTGTTMDLGVNPTSTTVNADTTVTIVIPTTGANYLSFLPRMTLGNSKIVQGSANGVIFSSMLNGNTIEIILTSVTGTFSTSAHVELVLDNTADIFSLNRTYISRYDISVRNIPCIYPILSNADIETYQDVFDYGLSLNNSITASWGQGNCGVTFGNMVTPPNLALTNLPTNINNQFYNPVWNYVVVRPGVIPRTNAQTMCAMSFLFGANIYNFNPFNDIYISGFDNSPYASDQVDMSVGGVGDLVAQAGWNVVANNAQGQQYLLIGRNGRTTINNITDNEFYPTYVLDTKDYIRRQFYLICKRVGIGQVRITPDTITAIRQLTYNLYNFMGSIPNPVLANVPALLNKIVIRQSNVDPLGIYAFLPIQQTPAFLRVYTDIINYSIELDITTANVTGRSVA